MSTIEEPERVARVIWLDNDVAFQQPFVEALRDAGVAVTLVRRVSEAEEALASAQWDLALVDAMIPLEENEEAAYPPAESDDSHRTGLIFYRRMKRLGVLPAKTAVLTVRIDKAIKADFVGEGLPEKMFWTKMDLRRTATFVERVMGALIG